MELSRLLTHPVLLNKRSRFIFITFSFATAVTCAVLWYFFFKMVAAAGLNLDAFPSEPNPLLSFLLSPVTHFAIAAFSALIGGALTAYQIVGPIRRIEEWLADLEQGRKVKPIKIRVGDTVYANIIQMMNSLQAKKLPHTRK